MLDEPSAALDSERIRFLESFVEVWQQERSAGVLLVKHSSEQAKRVVDKMFDFSNKSFEEKIGEEKWEFQKQKSNCRYIDRHP